MKIIWKIRAEANFDFEPNELIEDISILKLLFESIIFIAIYEVL